ncbi:hypothetical protein C1645_877774 [Glomus cerebriforme]|uniref:Uncharacterized protein n=1 Tax=Glomus cerebriforme TaxID=658196 RepID=A0A397SP04_9GLOM|nr:hypothetical protein C1645_877774 [Glomus cerebriforme]
MVEIVSDNKLEQNDLQISIDNDKEKNKSKRIHSNISDENERNLIVKSKKMKVNNNEDEVYNDPNLYSED